MVSMLHGVELVDSTAWEEECLRQCADGGLFLTRIEEASSMARVRGCLSQHSDLMQATNNEWDVLAPKYVTAEHNNIAFAMLARSMGGVVQLFAHHCSYP
jgi:hypothetical protein